MTDPTFTTRAELEAWLDHKERWATIRDWRYVIKDIRRVTLAHAHLPQEPK